MNRTPFSLTDGKVSGTRQRGSLSYLGYGILRMSRDDTRSASIRQYKNNHNNWIHLCTMDENSTQRNIDLNAGQMLE